LTVVEAILLGLVQGLAEFLPVSSSGHLALLQYIFGIEGESVLTFAVLLHIGTLLSLIAVYYMDIILLFKELFSALKDLLSGKGLQMYKNEYRTLGIMIIIATIPTAFFGLTFSDVFGALYNSLLAIGIGFLITGTLLWLAEKAIIGNRPIDKMRLRDALVIGLFQSVAIAPGISRSGSTIVGGLLSGINRELAVRFAFLISIPAILGAVVIEAPKAFEGGMDAQLLLPVILGVFVAAISGYIAIKFMIRLVSNKKLHYFSYYTWTLGIITILYAFYN
jgi:undecaprenyl-diphosphatase